MTRRRVVRSGGGANRRRVELSVVETRCTRRIWHWIHGIKVRTVVHEMGVGVGGRAADKVSGMVEVN